jgi:predicted Zn-dependent protease
MTTKSRKEQLQELLADQPEDAFLRYALGMEYVSEGKDEEAVTCFRQLWQATPDYAPAYHQAAQALLRLGRTTEAASLLSQGAAVARSQGDLHASEEMLGLLDTIR